MRFFTATIYLLLASYASANPVPKDDCNDIPAAPSTLPAPPPPLPSQATSHPTGTPGPSSSISKDKMIEVLKEIAPASAKEPCVSAAKAEGQCRSASQAAEPIIHSFEKYKITSKPEMAAILSLIALESGEFKYQKNVFPGRPGQGTRNMQMPNFNALYAKSIPELAAKIGPKTNNVDAVLDMLLSKDDYDFGSAAWFLTTQCTPAVRTALQSGSEEGWSKYLTECIGTTAADERKKYWTKAMESVKSL
ncbi:TPA_exp: Uncharacterized protein A8136_3307 [Trichophyton benhamiae CBS 112371]|uniref:Transglycosylase SLT domain-containing protein n=1 Tax=Arthroderma benhamiae (strain ATCC MYA-4681 / CBS 112371) TaxID=663331 RepID=D4B015_ARTBC|nr:uncharacterized protein ARB_01786 [Trichophyton benhamiae CBS 112371]EFE31390.1 conserved hypothetical protein [Trichophyton benhamiae CBS 112371]DAA74549.1 TPA_exp: Uncharacterized protein A8136_3307 [Trichophyton benhamiae CBS 112371]